MTVWSRPTCQFWDIYLMLLSEKEMKFYPLPGTELLSNNKYPLFEATELHCHSAVSADVTSMRNISQEAFLWFWQQEVADQVEQEIIYREKSELLTESREGWRGSLGKIGRKKGSWATEPRAQTYSPATNRRQLLWPLLDTDWTPELALGSGHHWGDCGHGRPGILRCCCRNKFPHHPRFLASLDPESVQAREFGHT